MIKQLFFIISLIAITNACTGQPYYFENYQSENGLPHNSVTSVIQDHKGFIWIGTKGGLNRYDGSSFRNFAIPEEGSAANSISSLSEDKKGRLWIGTFNGLFLFDPYVEHIARVNVPYASIQDIQLDHDDNLWMITNGKISMYNPRTEKKVSTRLHASALAIGNNGILWTGTAAGRLRKVSIGDGKLITTDVKVPGKVIHPSPITRLLPHGDQLLIGSRRGFFKYDLKKDRFVALLTSNPDGTDVYVRDIRIMADGKCWLATESGIFIYDLMKNTYTNIKKRAGDPYSLSDNAVYTLFQDNRHGIWAGTFFAGLNYLSKENGKFEKYYPLNADNSISGSAVREISADNDHNIWIGTEDAGINKFDPRTGGFLHFSNGNNVLDLSYPNIHGLLVSEDKVLAGPFLKGLEVLNRSTGKVVERYPIEQPAGNSSNAFVMSIFKTTTGQILVGTTGAGLFNYDPVLKRLYAVPQIPRRSFVYALYEDQTGTIWTGSLANGAFFFNPKTGLHGNVRFRTKQDVFTRDDIIQGIYQDTRKNLWFATEGGGLIKLDTGRKTFKRFDTKMGFPTNNIYRMLEDGNGNLWISSLKGLICLNLDTERFHVYSQSNGLLTDQFNYNSAYKDPSGKMYFGSVKGMIAFHPDSLKSKTNVPPLYITSVHINGKGNDQEVAGQDKVTSLIYTDTLRLSYNQSTFDIEFAALDFSAPNLIRYMYRMDGLNNQWTHMQTNRRAYFTDLAPGGYTFVVQAESNIGLWMSKPRVLHIIISPPFWKSHTAYISYLVLLCASLYIVVSLYHRNIESKNKRRQKLFELEKEKEIYQAKIEFFTNIAHEIQTPLTLIKGPIDWALERVHDVATVKRNLELVKKNTSRLIALTSELLDFRKTEQYQFRLNFLLTNINELLLEQVDAFSTSCAEKGLNVDVELSEKVVEAFVDQEACIKIISNLMSNAIKYSKKNIRIALMVADAEEGDFVIRVENDGQVIPETYQSKIFEPFFRIKTDDGIRGTGIGLPLAKHLAELHQGKLVLIVNEEINIFELTLPITQDTQFDMGLTILQENE